MSGIDNLTKTDMSGIDNLTRTVNSGADNLSASAGSAVDNLAKSSGTAADNMSKHSYTLINEDTTLDDVSPTTLDVLNADDFPESGSGTVRKLATAVEENVTWTGKTETTLTGVLCTSTSFAVVVGDKIETR